MKEINDYIDKIFADEDQLLADVLSSIAINGMPAISVSPSTGKLLTLLVSMARAQNALEIGALGGYSGICIARGFGEEGMLTSLELEERYANLAYENLTKAGFGQRVTYHVGAALQSLENLVQNNKKFDFFFIDADKENYSLYLEYCIQLAEPGAFIVTDNVLAGGSVISTEVKSKRYTEIMKEFNELVANHPRLQSILVPLGDGMTLSQVKNKPSFGG
ncbi:O-methyltransferase [Lysinibacillus piscis]|nr:O-methyltransferase [Lysinibacillus sp. KH24]